MTSRSWRVSKGEDSVHNLEGSSAEHDGGGKVVAEPDSLWSVC